MKLFALAAAIVAGSISILPATPSLLERTSARTTSINGRPSLSEIPVNRSFRCPVTLTTAAPTTNATVPPGMGFALTAVTIAESYGLDLNAGQTLPVLRIQTGTCDERHHLPGAVVSAHIGFSERRLVLDPPIILSPNETLSLAIFTTAGSTPLAPSVSVTFILGGLVLYPGEF